MSNSKAVKEALENARIVALAREESVPDTRPPGESLYNVVVRAVEHEFGDFIPGAMPPPFDPDNPRTTSAIFEDKKPETILERIVFAPDAAEACERALDAVAWDFGEDVTALTVAPV